MCIFSSGNIYICYWNNGDYADGKYIYIYTDGDFEVGERLTDDGGEQQYKYTLYKKDGTTEQFDNDEQSINSEIGSDSMSN